MMTADLSEEQFIWVNLGPKADPTTIVITTLVVFIVTTFIFVLHGLNGLSNTNFHFLFITSL